VSCHVNACLLRATCRCVLPYLERTLYTHTLMPVLWLATGYCAASACVARLVLDTRGGVRGVEPRQRERVSRGPLLRQRSATAVSGGQVRRLARPVVGVVQRSVCRWLLLPRGIQLQQAGAVRWSTSVLPRGACGCIPSTMKSRLSTVIAGRLWVCLAGLWCTNCGAAWRVHVGCDGADSEPQRQLSAGVVLHRRRAATVSWRRVRLLAAAVDAVVLWQLQRGVLLPAWLAVAHGDGVRQRSWCCCVGVLRGGVVAAGVGDAGTLLREQLDERSRCVAARVRGGLLLCRWCQGAHDCGICVAALLCLLATVLSVM
jgi:hypothetical protein